MSAREDRQLWRGMTGLHLLEGLAMEDEEGKVGGGGRRDTAIGMGSNAERLASNDSTWDSWRELENP